MSVECDLWSMGVDLQVNMACCARSFLLFEVSQLVEHLFSKWEAYPTGLWKQRCLNLDFMHVSPDPCESTSVDERRDLIVRHHSEFFFFFFFFRKKRFVVPTDGAKLLIQFSAWWRVGWWFTWRFALFFMICKIINTAPGVPTIPLRCLSQMIVWIWAE